jgi:hypothetical protein
MKNFNILFSILFYCLYVDCYGQKLTIAEINDFILYNREEFYLITFDSILKNQYKTIEASCYDDQPKLESFYQKLTYSRKIGLRTFVETSAPFQKYDYYLTNGVIDSLLILYPSPEGYDKFYKIFYDYRTDSLLAFSYSHNYEQNWIDTTKYTYHWYKPNHVRIVDGDKDNSYEIQKINKNLIKYKWFGLLKNKKKEELLQEITIDYTNQLIREQFYMYLLGEISIFDDKRYWFNITTDFKNGKIEKTQFKGKNGKYKYVTKYKYLDE